MKNNYFSRFGIYLVPAIMLFFFARNIALSNTEHLDTWMGGGMRMFGEVDKMLYRVSGFYTNYNGKTYFVNFRNVKSAKSDDSYLRVMPSDNRLSEVAGRIKKAKWCFDPVKNTFDMWVKSSGLEPIINIKIDSIVVYRTAFDSGEKAITLKAINKYIPE